MPFEPGLILTHSALPELGRARVEAIVGDNLHLVFESAHGGEQKVFKASNASLSPAADQSPSGFPAKKLSVAVTGKRKAPKASGAAKPSNAWNFDEAMKRFSAKYPGGFSDPKYVADERDYKSAAITRCGELFSDAGLARLKASGDPAEVEKAFAKAYEGLNLLHVIEWLKFRAALKASPKSLALAEAYADVIKEGTLSEAQFGRLLACFDAIGLGKGNWTLLTLWPYLAAYKGFVFLKPKVTQAAAAGMGLSLNYDAKPNYLTYQSTVAFYEALWLLLEPQGARDWVDLQSFIWVGWK